MGDGSRFSPEVIERAVRLVFEQVEDNGPTWPVIVSVASKIGCTAETLRRWVRQAERDAGKPPPNRVISGSPLGAFGSATLYSFIETAKACGREPYYYLRYVLTKLPATEPEGFSRLLPWNVDPMDFGELTAEDARLSIDSIPVT